MGNSHGSYNTTTQATMLAYDKLPRSVRQALANSLENWAPQPIRTQFEKGRWSALECVKRIMGWDRNELTKREYQRSRAIGLYHGNARDAEPMKAKRRRRM